MAPRTGLDGHLLTFDVGGTTYALPITEVAEVTAPKQVACVPTLPDVVGGVINHHGDVLPVVTRGALFQVDDSTLPEPEQLVVVSEHEGGSGSLGLPVDRVIGLTQTRGRKTGECDDFVETRSIRGEQVQLLDAKRLLERAREAIERAAGRTESAHKE